MDFPFVVNESEVMPALLTTHPFIAMPYVFLLGIFAFFGTLGNILVIGTNLTAKKKDQMVGDIFMVNLAASDMIVTALINPIAIMGTLFSYLPCIPFGSTFSLLEVKLKLKLKPSPNVRGDLNLVRGYMK